MTCPTGLFCVNGACVADDDLPQDCTTLPDGTPCGDSTSSECDQPDVCSGGTCSANPVAAGTGCGDAPATDCSAGMACDGAGACAPKTPANEGAACYDCDAGAGLCAGCNATEMCVDATCTPVLTTSTLQTNDPGGFSEHGQMFDVVASRSLTITGVAQNFNGGGGTRTFAIYYKAGTHVGFEGTPNAWTFVGMATVNANAEGTLTTIPIAINLAIPAGQRYALYVTNTAGNNVSYNEGSAVGAVQASNAELTIYEGTGVAYGSAGFSTPRFTPREWEGRLTYTHGTQLAATGAGGTTSDGVMFEVVAQNAVRTNALSIDLEPGAATVDVYMRRGPRAGFEDTSAGWELLASDVAVTGGGVTSLPLGLDVIIAAGTTTSFYVTSGAGTARIRSTAGTATPSDANATIRGGTTIAGELTGAGTSVTPHVVLGYTRCQ
jgi:hypothetical protein